DESGLVERSWRDEQFDVVARVATMAIGNEAEARVVGQARDQLAYGATSDHDFRLAADAFVHAAGRVEDDERVARLSVGGWRGGDGGANGIESEGAQEQEGEGKLVHGSVERSLVGHGLKPKS